MWSRLGLKSVCVCVRSRCKQLEKEQAILKEKIHHLDDMLKSQQRKVRHMIEQVKYTYTRTPTHIIHVAYVC